MLTRRRLVGALLAVASMVATNAAIADPLHDPIKVELPAPVEGAPDPGDPPLTAAPDPDVATLAVPEQGPWMLFDESELPALRDRILGAEPGSVIGRAWQQLKGRADACCVERSSYQDGLEDLETRTFGRDDLAELAFVWRVTQDGTYLAKARQLLQYVVATAPDHGAPREPGVDEFYIQRAHRLNGFALAYDLLRDALAPEERAQLLEVVAALGQQQYAHSFTAWWGNTTSTGSNIGAVNVSSLGTAGLALWHDFPEARAWVVRGEQLTRAYFHEGFDTEGAGIEGVLYGNYGMRVPTILNHALRRAGHTNSGNPGIDRVGGIDKHQEWVAYEVLPGGGAVNPINDARYYEFNPSFTTWSTTYGDTPELSRWIFDEVVLKHPAPRVGELIPTLLWYEPSQPGFDPAQMLPLAKVFPGRGLVHVRSGWDEGDLMASFEARQNDWGEGVHQNQDVNSFVLYANDARLVVDSRYGNWLAQTAAGDREAARTSETEAHNYLVADGRSQDFLGKGDLQHFASTSSEVGERGGLDIAVGDARKAYMTDQPQRAERVFLHVRADEKRRTPAYIVVADRFQQDDAEHDYTWFLHSDWMNTMSLPTSSTMRVEAPNGAGLTTTMHTAQPVSAREIDFFTPDDAQDWNHVSGQSGPKAQPRLKVSSRAKSFESIAVLAPTAPGQRAPEVTTVPAEGGIAVTVDHGRGVVDTILLATGDNATVSAAGVKTDGIFGFVRRHGKRSIQSSAGVRATDFDVDGQPLLSFPAPQTFASSLGVARFSRMQ